MTQMTLSKPKNIKFPKKIKVSYKFRASFVGIPGQILALNKNYSGLLLFLFEFFTKKL